MGKRILKEVLDVLKRMTPEEYDELLKETEAKGTGDPIDEPYRNRAIIQCPQCGDWYYPCCGHIYEGSALLSLARAVWYNTIENKAPNSETPQQVVPADNAARDEGLPSTTDDARYRRGIP